MGDDMFLYWGSGSPPCWRVMIVLEEKGITNYGQKLLHFDKNEHKSEEVLKLNPRGQVPTFRDGNVIINESLAICDYLEHKYKDKGEQLYPDDLKTRATVLQRTHEIQNVHDRVIVKIVHYKRFTKPAEQDQDILAKRYEEARKELELWEKYFSEAADKSFLAGRSFTMADVVVFPIVAILFRLGLNAAKYPGMAFYYSQLKDRASIHNTWPPHWKNSPNSNTLSDL